MILNKFQIGKLNAALKGNGSCVGGIEHGTRCHFFKETVHSACCHNDGTVKFIDVAGEKVGKNSSAALIVADDQILETVVRIAIHESLRLILSDRVNHGGHHHLAGAAFDESGAFLLLTAEAALNDAFFVLAERNAELLELSDNVGCVAAKSVDGIRIGEIGAAVHSVLDVIFNFVILVHGVEHGVNAALCHD